MTQVSEKEEVSLLISLSLPPDSDADKVEERLSNGSDNNFRLFCRLGQLRNKKSAILNRTNYGLKTEQDFRKTCALYKNNSNHWLLRTAYKEYISAYQKIASLYNLRIRGNEINLLEYDTENEKEYVKALETSLNIEHITFTVQLPNGEVFVQCESGHDEFNVFFLVIDKNYRVRQLPHESSDYFTSGIYFNRSIYCFGKRWNSGQPLSARFDLNENRWIYLASIIKGRQDVWNVITFNMNILIYMKKSSNILIYSTDIDSFSTITYKKKKDQLNVHRSYILMNSEERLYLIENQGWIYESEINNVFSLKKISFSGIDFGDRQVHCSYNKGGIYFMLTWIYPEIIFREYFKFDLCKKEIVEIACYNDNLSLKKIDGKLKVIECRCENFQLYSDEIKNGNTLRYIFMGLSGLLKRDPDQDNFLEEKGKVLLRLGWYFEAIECYSKIIKLDSKNGDAYIGKGMALHELGKNSKALKYYNKAIKLKPSNDVIFYKGLALHDLGRNIEAIECYDKSIKFDNQNSDAYLHKGVALNDLGRNDEAMECYNKAIELCSCDSKLYFCRAYLFNKLGQEEMAFHDFNAPYSSMMEYNYDKDGAIIYNCCRLVKMLLKLLESTVKFKKETEKLRNSSLKSLDLLKETDKNESIIKKKNSKLIKRAIECLDFEDKCKPIEEILQIGKEISEHQKGITDMNSQLSLFFRK